MNVLETNKFDAFQWKSIEQESGEIQKKILDGSDRLESFPDLMSDLFNCLYKPKPSVRPDGEIPASHAINKTIVSETLNTSEWRDLHSATMLDSVSSAIGCMSLADSINLPVEQSEQANQIADLERELQHFGNQAESLESLIQETKDQDAQGRLSKKLRGTRKAMQTIQERLNSEIQKMPQPDPDKLRRQMRKACKRASDAVDQTNDMMASIGWGTEPGQMQRMPMEERLQIAQRIHRSSKLKLLSEMVGRFQRVAVLKQSTKTTHGLDEVVDITIGADLGRVLPSELSKLRHPVFRRDFYRRFIERRLLEYHLEAKEQEGKGPIIVLVDSSGTMSGSREMWAKAVAIALLLIAKRQKRDVIAAHFASENEYLEWAFLSGKFSPQDLLDFAESFFNGGTDFERPLSEALRWLEDSKFKKGDVIFLTDGECEVSEEFLQRFTDAKKKKGFRVFSVLIGSTQDATLQTFSDDIVRLTNLDKDAEALDMVFGI